MTTNLSTRRAILGAAVALPAVAAMAGTKAIASGSGADRSAWDRAFAAMQAADAAHRKASAAYDRVHAEWEKDRPSMDSIHWGEFAFADKRHVARIMDVEAEWSSFLAGEGKGWFAPDPEPVKARRRAALDSVLDFRRREQEHDERFGYSAAADRSNAACDAFCEAEYALLEMPAPDAEALLWKLEYLLETECGYMQSFSDTLVQPVIADARRLLSTWRA